MNQAAKIALLTTEYSQDGLGEWVETSTPRDVFAYVSSVGMNEFYQAGLQGMKPEYRFLIWTTEYEGEELPGGFICPICKHPVSDFTKVTV